MQISEFNGIKQYHDGRPVADYCNMVPMGNSVIDRHGEELLTPDIDMLYHDEENPVVETFVDSMKNIYIARRNTLERAWLTEGFENGKLFKRWSRQTMETFTSAIGKASFCESSTKPAQVYFCDGTDVYYWSLEYGDKAMSPGNPFIGETVYPPFVISKLLLFKDVSTLTVGGSHIPLMDYMESLTEEISPETATESLAGWFPIYFEGGEHLKVTSITWFDNRLVCVEGDKNTVWLTSVDPSRFIMPSVEDPENPGTYMPWFPFQWTDNTHEKMYSWLMPNYYASTASSAVLQTAIAFAGQLYFLNDTSIEVWSATGNNDNPIQHNSQNTLYYGGRSPVIINDTLYLVCKGAIHNDFIAAIGQSGQIQHISNDEIERNLQAGVYCLKPLAVRDQSMIVAYQDERMTNGFVFTKEGRWWRYWNNRDIAIHWSIYNDSGTQFGISRTGVLAKATEDNRTYIDGRPILRNLRGAFLQFTSRKILRQFEVICDAGIYLDADMERPQMYLRVSFDRGNSFGPFLYRRMGSSRANDHVMVWRNCGSGNSIMLEFGTSDNVRFQIYGLDLEVS